MKKERWIQNCETLHCLCQEQKQQGLFIKYFIYLFIYFI